MLVTVTDSVSILTGTLWKACEAVTVHGGHEADPEEFWEAENELVDVDSNELFAREEELLNMNEELLNDDELLSNEDELLRKVEELLMMLLLELEFRKIPPVVGNCDVVSHWFRSTIRESEQFTVCHPEFM
jgi:hypothetical protein